MGYGEYTIHVTTIDARPTMVECVCAILEDMHRYTTLIVFTLVMIMFKNIHNLMIYILK